LRWIFLMDNIYMRNLNLFRHFLKRIIRGLLNKRQEVFVFEKVFFNFMINYLEKRGAGNTPQNKTGKFPFE